MPALVKKNLQYSYVVQHIAALIECSTTRGRIPLMYPALPSSSHIVFIVPHIPLYFLPNSPCVCSLVFATSNGFVSAAASDPAPLPAAKCAMRSYSDSDPRFSTRRKLS